MLEPCAEKSAACKLCAQESTHNLCIAHCIGCQDLFCFEHLIQHRKQSSSGLEKLRQRHADIKETSLRQLNLQQHLDYIDRWETVTTELIHRQAVEVREKLSATFEAYKSNLTEYHDMLGKELEEQRNFKACLLQNLSNLSQRVEQLEHELQQIDRAIRQISYTELQQFTHKLNVLTSSLGKPTHWTCRQKIKLDSTYGYMAANAQHIFLGWKNRIVIYNVNGIKHDESRLQSADICGELCDLIWSNTMYRLFILCQKSLFMYHPSSSQVEAVPNVFLSSSDNEYTSIATNGNLLILLDKQLLRLWQLNQANFHLQDSIRVSYIVKHPDAESVCCIRSNREHLAVLIQNSQTHTWRMDIFGLQPFARLQTGTPFDRFTQANLGALTAFHDRIFLFMNWETKLMHLLDLHGSSEVIDYNAYSACLLGRERLLAVNYMTHLKIYAF